MLPKAVVERVQEPWPDLGKPGTVLPFAYQAFR